MKRKQDMDCQTTQKFIEDYLDDLLEDASRDRFQQHVAQCQKCRQHLAKEQELRNALTNLPEPALDPDFEARAFRRAAEAHTRRRRIDSNRIDSKWIDPSMLIRIAASIVLVIALGFMFKDAWAPDQPELPKAFVRLNRPEKIQLVFYSEKSLENVTFSLKPQAGIELVGFENRREITWQTDLKQGENLLELPVIARSRQGGTVFAKIYHGSQNKQFGLRLQVRPPNGLSPDAGKLESRAMSIRRI